MTAPLENQRLFSVDDANRMLPLVKRIVADIVALSEELDRRQYRLDRLGNGPKGDQDNTHGSKEWDQIEQEIDADEDRLEEYVSELTVLGVELQDAGIGEVDFRTQIDGQDAYLCWRLGETEVAHWHPEDAGFESRQSLYLGTASPGSFPQSDATEP